MYNDHANGIWLNRLKKAVAGKKVILVGNSPGILNEENGEFIDSFDFVVRFGKGVPTDDLVRYIGRKTDMWFFGVLRTGNFRDFEHVKFKAFGYIQLGLYSDSRDVAFRKVMMSDRFQVYRDYFLTEHIGGMMNSLSRINGGREHINRTNRVSQGVYCLDWFLNRIKTQAEVHLIGFDFQQMGFKFKQGIDDKVSYSWHVPVSSLNGAASQIHSAREIAYVERLIEEKKIHFHSHDVNKIPVDILKKIAEKNRPEITEIYEHRTEA